MDPPAPIPPTSQAPRSQTPSPAGSAREARRRMSIDVAQLRPTVSFSPGTASPPAGSGEVHGRPRSAETPFSEPQEEHMGTRTGGSRAASSPIAMPRCLRGLWGTQGLVHALVAAPFTCTGDTTGALCHAWQDADPAPGTLGDEPEPQCGVQSPCCARLWAQHSGSSCCNAGPPRLPVSASAPAPRPTESRAAQYTSPSASRCPSRCLGSDRCSSPPNSPPNSPTNSPTNRLRLLMDLSSRASSAGPKRTKRVSIDEGSRSLPLASPRRSSLGARPVPDNSLMARIMSRAPDLDDHLLKQVRFRVWGQGSGSTMTPKPHKHMSSQAPANSLRGSWWHPVWFCRMPQVCSWTVMVWD